jgi:hypothetical protein
VAELLDNVDHSGMEDFERIRHGISVLLTCSVYLMTSRIIGDECVYLNIVLTLSVLRSVILPSTSSCSFDIRGPSIPW